MINQTRNRKLDDEANVFTQNAWDDFEWTDEMYTEAESRIQEQRRSSCLSEKDIVEKEFNVAKKWNEFYATHEDKFFKDRKWIFSEFPELLRGLAGPNSQEPYHVFEVGCGVGNSVVHILEHNTNPHLRINCCDLSSVAVETLKRRHFYLKHSDKVTAFQADICLDFESKVLAKVPLNSQDIIMLIFTLSALKPDLMKQTIQNLTTLLKPGGMLLFRDYAKYDMTQLRFKSFAYLHDNYYIRSDGTTSYFFSEDNIKDLFANLDKVELKHDKRLLVNRSKGIRMCRCWIQGKYTRV